jgi:hypothetical protein
LVVGKNVKLPVSSSLEFPAYFFILTFVTAKIPSTTSLSSSEGLERIKTSQTRNFTCIRTDASAAFNFVKIKTITSITTVTLDPCRDAIRVSTSSAAASRSAYSKPAV